MLQRVSRSFQEIRIENTNSCRYKCWFCPRELHERVQGVMSIDDFKILLRRLPDDCQSIDLHGYGEPLLDSDLAEKVKLAKRKWPSSRLRIITTMGVSKGAGKIAALAEAGLTSVEISYYGTDKDSYKRAHGVNAYDLATANIAELQAMNLPNFEVVVRSLEGADRGNEDELEKEVSSIEKGKLHNFGSGREFNAAPKGVCSVVDGLRSRILQVTWQLDVIPCCFDYNAEVKLGNLREQELEEIFSSSTYQSFVSAHLGNVIGDLSPCNKCEKCFKD